MKETQIQKRILDWLDVNEFPAIRLNNGGQYDPTRKVRRKPGTGFMPGLPDIIVFLGHGICLIEVKSATGKQSTEQKMLQAALEGLGCSYVVARSVNDVQFLLGDTAHFAKRSMGALFFRRIRQAHNAKRLLKAIGGKNAHKPF